MRKVLRVNLGSKEIQIDTIDPSEEEKYIGGTGVAASIFTKSVPPDTDPFDGDNLLIFSVGPFTGTAVPLTGRHFVMAKSPLTGIIGEASCGGFFGKELKFAGFDHVIIKGISTEPIFLWINDENVEIRDAKELWGLGIQETEKRIKQLLGDENIKTASIGPAGENRVKIASIMSETSHGASRCGLGAVMGSKKLKAIAVRGTKSPSIHNKEKLLIVAKELQKMVNESPFAIVMSDVGTLAHMDNYVSAGDVPIKNFTMSRWKGTKSIGYYAVKDKYEIKHYSCFNCTVGCRGKILYKGEWIAWPEYETLGMIGSNLMVDDLEALIEWGTLINDYGMDTISLGGIFGVFLEALDRKLINLDMEELGFKRDPETNEYQVWGAVDAIEKLIEMTALRKGIGNDLAEGVRRLCEKYNLPNDLKIHSKGLEIPAHEPRSNNMTALDLATSSRGAFHGYEPFHLSFMTNFKEELGLTERIDPFSGGEEIVDAVKKIQDAGEAYCAGGGCIFAFFYIHKITPYVEAYNAITGNSLSVEDWVKRGENIFNLKRKYNISCGISKADDSIGARFSKPIPKGGTKKNVPPLKELVSKYYELRGWDEHGNPI